MTHWICRTCIKELDKLLGRHSTVTLQLNSWGLCDFCHTWPWPTHFSVQLAEDEIVKIQQKTRTPTITSVLAHVKEGFQAAIRDLSR